MGCGQPCSRSGPHLPLMLLQFTRRPFLQLSSDPLNRPPYRFSFLCYLQHCRATDTEIYTLATTSASVAGAPLVTEPWTSPHCPLRRPRSVGPAPCNPSRCVFTRSLLLLHLVLWLLPLLLTRQESDIKRDLGTERKGRRGGGREGGMEE